MTPRSALVTQAPFHLEATVRVLQRRPSNPMDIWDVGRYRRVLALSEGLALVEVENRGTIDDPDVRFGIRAGNASASTRRGAGRALRKILGLNVDPAPLQRLAENERALRDTACVLRGMRPPRFPSLFETFANVVPFQQLSLEAGVAIVGRLVTKFGEPFDHDGRRFYAFPTAQAIAGVRLTSVRACGLSGAKAQTLREVARAIASGTLTAGLLSGMSTNAALKRLCELPGIGPWSAALVLLRGLGRIDVFPPGDVGAERGLRALLHLAPGAPLDSVIEHFGEHRGYLYFYALGAWLAARGLIHAAPSKALAEGR